MTSLYNVNYLQHLCQKYGLIPSKKYGQNFLINEEPIMAMLEAGEIKKDDVVVEVGPGFGVLTLALGEKAKKVISYEIEKKLESYWTEQVEKNKNIEIVWGNVLNQNIDLRKYKVIANLPYQITSNVIRKFLEAENRPEFMVLMVQKEVAQRICASPGDMSVLAVSVQCYGEPEIVMNVPKSYFWPVPGVDSAIIKIKNIKSDKIGEGFFKIVKSGFANRRKMLVKNLEPMVGKQNKEKLKKVFVDMKISEKVRAQELSIEQWQGLTSQIQNIL
jgi:16S rRNA (adenine1518-N6/adenine1519-N6)-dimethyltransferase